MRNSIFALLAVVAVGCAKHEPPLSGGKPVDHWLQAMKDPDPKVRRTAALKLGNVGTTHADVVPALITALKDREGKVRCEAILALAKMGAAARDAIPGLTEIQAKDQSEQARSYAAKALASLRAHE